MAYVVQKMFIMDGPSHVTLHVILESDGAGGELTNYVLLDPTTELSPPMPARQDLIVKQIWHELSDMRVQLAFNATTPWPFWTLAPGSSNQHDWRFFGGIRDNSDAPMGLDSDGKLLITTTTVEGVIGSASFVLWMEKRDRPNPQS